MGSVAGYRLDRPRYRPAGAVLAPVAYSDPHYPGCLDYLSPPLLTAVLAPVGAALRLWYHHPRSDPPAVVGAVAVLEGHLHHCRGLAALVLLLAVLIQNTLWPVPLSTELAALSPHNQPMVG